MIGPDNTPYAGGIFFLDIKFPKNYPSSAPLIRFNTKIYHPLVWQSGTICDCCYIQTNEDNWNPELTIRKLMINILNGLNLKDIEMKDQELHDPEV